MSKVTLRIETPKGTLTGSVNDHYGLFKIDLRSGGRKLLTGVDQDAHFEKRETAVDHLIKRAFEWAKVWESK